MNRSIETINMSERNYSKVNESEHKTWNPSVTIENIADFDPKDDSNNIMEGYLLDVKYGVGKFKQNVYKIHEVLKDGSFGEIYSVWGNTVLNGTLPNIKLGTFVCLKYEGWKAKKGFEGKHLTDKTAFQNWSVFEDKNALPYNEAKGGLKEAAPIQTGNATAQPKKNSRGGAPAANNATFADDQLPF